MRDRRHTILSRVQCLHVARSSTVWADRIDALSYNQGNTYGTQTVVWIITCNNYSLTSGKTTFCSGARAGCDETRDWREREREWWVGKKEDAKTGCFYIHTSVCSECSSDNDADVFWGVFFVHLISEGTFCHILEFQTFVEVLRSC